MAKVKPARKKNTAKGAKRFAPAWPGATVESSTVSPYQGRLKGKVAVVSGSGDGIGKGIALMFARQGAHVVGCDINAEKAKVTAALAKKEGLSFESVHPVDLMKEASAKKVMDVAVKKFGGLDVLVNAAATCVMKPVDKLTYADWQLTMTAEVDSVFFMCQAAWPHLKKSGHGSIINFASANAWEVLDDQPALAHCAGKGAVLAMTRQLALEGAPFQIRANTISPALVVTGATSSGPLAMPGWKDKFLSKMMLRRLGVPEDIAWAVTYLASDEASWVTAADFRIDGGATHW